LEVEADLAIVRMTPMGRKEVGWDGWRLAREVG
jgi:hypothetical protein